MLYIAVPIPLALSAILILVTDLGFELFLALSFAWDTTENKTGLMKLEPRKPVTPESIARLKRIEARGSESWVSRLINQFKDPAFEENLVDGEVLSWAYVEAGTIEAIGCFTCFYFALSYSFGISVADTIKYGAVWGLATTGPITLANGVSLSVESQVEALAQGQSAFYLALLIQQCFNLFACKARLRLPFGSFMWSNMRNFYGTIFGAVFTFAIVYIPPVNVAFGTSYRTTPYVWIIAFAFGWLLFIYSTVRFLLRRLWNPIKYSKDVVGLDLHPTRFSTGR